MMQIYCPQCGNPISGKGEQQMATCPFCRAQVPIPKGYTELESSFRYAMDARLRRDFVAAESAYEEIIKQHPDSAAAYWGRALSRYAVEYQPIGGEAYRLVCHQAELTDFADDADVNQAILRSVGKEQAYYLEESEKVSQLQKEVAAHAAITSPYQAVIIADGANEAAMAQVKKIETAFRASGVRSYCPAAELQKVPRQNWEPYLYRAITTAETMIYVAVGADSFSKDLMFDAERFLSLQAQEQRMASAKVRQFAIVFDGLDEYADIPDSLFDGAETRLPLADESYLDELCELTAKKKVDTVSGSRSGNTGGSFEYSNLLV